MSEGKEMKDIVIQGDVGESMYLEEQAWRRGVEELNQHKETADEEEKKDRVLAPPPVAAAAPKISKENL
jgi:hypothetical protein